MLALLQSTWSAVVPRLRERVGAAVFEAWFTELRPLALERGVVHLEAPNRMTCEHVQKLYTGLIAECMSAEFGTALTVQVEPAPTSFSPDGVDVGPTRPVIDAANKTAFLALGSLIEGRDLPSNLFLFHGPAGAGKSFLLSWWRDHHRDRVMSFSGTDLIKAFQVALTEHRVAGFREELQRSMPLVIDEVHRVTGHRRLQLELARVLEVRRSMRVPTLLTSRWHPSEIWNLEQSLETWLLSGFVARIDEPTLAGRLQYLRALEGKPSMNGRARPIEDLARSVRGGYPELRRAWAVDRDGGRHADRYWQLIEPRSVFDRLQQRVAEALDVTPEELTGGSQRRRASQARKVLAWLCVQEGLSRAEVGRYLGGRTRAAISYSIKSLEKDMAENEALRLRVEGLS